MDAISEKQKILELVENTYADLMDLVAALSPQEKTAKGNLKHWLGAAIMSIQAWFGDKNTDFFNVFHEDSFLE